MSSVPVLFSLASNAGVQSYSSERHVEVDGQYIGEKIVATCHSGYGKQEILKKDGEALWCGITVAGICARRKAVAAELVCSRSYQRKAALKQTDNEKERIIRLKEELIQIEQKRLDIAEKLLNLKRQEMALRSRF